MKDREKGQQEKMIEVSQIFERCWEVLWNPERFSPEEIVDSVRFISEESLKFLDLILLSKYDTDNSVTNEELELIFQGLYHHSFTLPANRSQN